jgi:hypothetical protein
VSAASIDKKTAARRLAVRGGLVAVYAALIALVFVTGKSHTILVDNKDRAEGPFQALDGILVSVNGKESLELYAGDRDMVKIQGQRLRVTLESLSGGDKKSAELTIPMDQDMLLLSVPMLAAGRTDCLERFVTADQPREAEGAAGDESAFTSPEASTSAAPTSP